MTQQTVTKLDLQHDLYIATRYQSMTVGLRAEWTELWRSASYAHISNSPEWHEAACDAFGYIESAIITLHSKHTQKLVAVLPLVKYRMYGMSILTTTAVEFAGHTSLLIDSNSDELMQCARTTMSHMESLVCLANLYKGEADYLCVGRDRGVMYVADEEFYTNPSDGVYGLLSKRKIRQVKNRTKKLGDDVTIQIKEDKIKDVMLTCFDIDKESVKDQKGKGVFARDDVSDFYFTLAKKLPESFSITLMYIKEKPVAYWMFYKSDQLYMGSQKAYLKGYEYYSPGFSSFIKFLEFNQDVSQFQVSLGRGRDRFKVDFTSKTKSLYTVLMGGTVISRTMLKILLQGRERVYRFVVSHQQLYILYKNITGWSGRKK